MKNYCKFENFHENFIFANSVKIHICNINNLRLGQDLPISVNDRVIWPFCEDLIFTKLSTKTKTSLKFPNLHNPACKELSGSFQKM